MITSRQQQQRRRSTPRRSTRKTNDLFIGHFRPPWNQHYQDMEAGRFQKCSKRILKASDGELESLYMPLLSLGISHSSKRRPQSVQETKLIEYATALLSRGIDPNDHFLIGGDGIKGRSAVSAAAYYGYTRLLKFLLVEGNCSITTGDRHALWHAVESKKHKSMEVLFDHRSNQLNAILETESQNGASFGYDPDTLAVAIQQNDVAAVRMLVLERGRARDYRSSPPEYRKLKKILLKIYPNSNMFAWSKQLHWSFSHKDRQMINWIWYRVRSGTDPKLPEEVWLNVLSYLGRYWWP